jgi:glutamate--cysteine ligase catalytic subunit
MTVDEIINGKIDGSFPGLIPLVESYLDSMNVDVETRCEIAQYLDLIKGRANGSLWTAAKWIRHFVREHKEYKKDSVVTDGMAYDLVKAAERITVNEGRDGYALEMLGEGRERPN